jgi:hypothetical protein
MQLSSSSPSSSSSTGTSSTLWTGPDGTLHERYHVLVLVGHDLLGEFYFDPGSHPELGYRRSGVAYYCSWCGDVWARLVFVDSRGTQASLDAETIACEKHADQWNLAGSLLAQRLEELIQVLPPAAVKREFEIHLRHYLKEIRNDHQ